VVRIHVSQPNEIKGLSELLDPFFFALLPYCYSFWSFSLKIFDLFNDFFLF